MSLLAITEGVYTPGRFNKVGQVTGEGTGKTQHLILQLEGGVGGCRVGHPIPVKNQLVAEDKNALPTGARGIPATSLPPATMRALTIKCSSGHLREERLRSSRPQNT